ncbi:MAG TPA: YggS family pyridoxal phosphate-dependent enzyme [Terriglobales bacterium]|nr:YggS family pyridoxal phosphate-dependent enzyme [Terriglobales bacterium]
MSIAENVAEVRGRIASAARRAGRNPEEIALLAVSKTFSPQHIREAYQAGLRMFGENRVQEFTAKAVALGDLRDAEWHMIGHLQSNKAAAAAAAFAAIDSLDSLKLAEKLNSSAEKLNKTIEVLIEVNVGGEAAKSGVAPDSDELENLLNAALTLERLKFRGLMTIPPFAEDAQEARPYFQKLRALRDQVAAQRLRAVRMDVLSMGMSHDFEIAIEEGSNCVRVGTAIFGERTRR